LTKIFICDENFYFWRKFLTFDENFDFWRKFLFLRKIFIFEENFDFGRNFWFLTKIFIFDENYHLWVWKMFIKWNIFRNWKCSIIFESVLIIVRISLLQNSKLKILDVNPILCTGEEIHQSHFTDFPRQKNTPWRFFYHTDGIDAVFYRTDQTFAHNLTP